MILGGSPGSSDDVSEATGASRTQRNAIVTFVDLPTEVRLQIFSYYFEYFGGYFLPTSRTSKKKANLRMKQKIALGPVALL